MKKIVILINSMDSGGAERVVSVLLNSWANKYECYLILLHSNIFYKLDERVNIIHLNENNELSGFKKLIRIPILAKKLSSVISERKFDQVISFLTRPNYINILANIFVKHRTIICERSMPSLQHEYGFQGRANKFLINSLYHKSDLCISNSEGNKRDLQDNFGVKHTISIPNPFDIDNIKKQSNAEITILKKRFTFVTVGRLDNGKNHILIIDAIKDLEADLWIIGDGELKRELEQYISKLNLEEKVYILGKKENPFAFISKADCFVFASNHEGFPNVLIEALACALPVISTDCKSGPREILSPDSDWSFQLKDKIEIAEFGMLVPIKNVEQLKISMSLMINDIQVRYEYKEKSMERANNFRIENVIKQYEEIICAE